MSMFESRPDRVLDQCPECTAETDAANGVETCPECGWVKPQGAD